MGFRVGNQLMHMVSYVIMKLDYLLTNLDKRTFVSFGARVRDFKTCFMRLNVRRISSFRLESRLFIELCVLSKLTERRAQ